MFELVIGRTEQTNKLSTFRLETEGTTAHIRLARHLDFESVSEYILTVRIQVRENSTALESVPRRDTRFVKTSKNASKIQQFFHLFYEWNIFIL